MMDHLKIAKLASCFQYVLYGVVIVITYHTTLKQLIFRDWLREDYSHCSLIPLVVLYMLWEKRKALNLMPSVPSWFGFIPFGAGIGLFWVGELGGEFYTLYLSLWLVIAGFAWIILGWMKIRIIWFALVMLLAMFPFPNFLNSKILLYLKMLSSRIGVSMLQIYGVSAYREGNVIDLGLTQLQVVDACSGLRYVIPLFVLSLLLAHWFKAPLWKRIVLVFSSVPLAVMVNSLRIAITGILYDVKGVETAESFFHGFSGWLIFMLTIPVLFIEIWILKKIEGRQEQEHKELDSQFHRNDRKQGNDEEGYKGDPAVEIPLVPPHPTSSRWLNIWKDMLCPPQFIVAIALLLLTLGISHTVDFRERIPTRIPFAQFPLKIGEWKGTPQFMEQQFIDTLHFNDYIMMNYQNAQAKDVDFYMVYYESQSKGAATHSPETCLPGSGWNFEESGTANVDLESGKTMDVHRAFMEKGGSRQLIYFWFPQRNRILTNLVQVKIYSFWDALTRQRTDGALIRIITPVYPEEDEKDAEARLQTFTRMIVPVARDFIPQ